MRQVLVSRRQDTRVVMQRKLGLADLGRGQRPHQKETPAMYGMDVKIDGRTISVMCSPNTPLSEVLLRASQQMAREEELARLCHPYTVAYRDAIRNR